MPIQNCRDVGAGYKRLFVFLVIALPAVVVKHKTDYMAKGRVADVMEKCRDLLIDIGAEMADEQHGSHGMIEAAERRRDPKKGSDAVL